MPLFETADGPTCSHQFALSAQAWGGGQAAAKRLRRSNLLACGIALPDAPVDGDVNGLRMGTPELVRLGMRADDTPGLADLIARGLDLAGEPEAVAPEVMAWRKQFSGVHFTADSPGWVGRRARVRSHTRPVVIVTSHEWLVGAREIAKVAGAARNDLPTVRSHEVRHPVARTPVASNPVDNS